MTKTTTFAVKNGFRGVPIWTEKYPLNLKQLILS